MTDLVFSHVALATLVLAVLFLLVVEALIGRRLKAHLKAVDEFLKRMTVASESIDALWRANKARLDRIEKTAHDAREGVRDLDKRVSVIEKKMLG